MKKVNLALLAIAIMVFPTSLWSAEQNLAVAAISGEVALQVGTAWKPLALGDHITSDAVIRLGKDSSAELTVGGARVLLMKEGSYHLDTVVAGMNRVRSGSLSAMLAKAMQLLSKAAPANAAIVAGVRGAEQDEAAAEWATSQVSVALDEAKALIQVGSYDAAMQQLVAALPDATHEETPELRFRLAVAAELWGDTKSALVWAKGVSPTGMEYWAPECWLLLARLDIDTAAYADAVTLLTGPARWVADLAGREQLYRLILATAYRGLGDLAAEQAQLKRIIAAGSGTALGQAAAAILREAKN